MFHVGIMLTSFLQNGNLNCNHTIHFDSACNNFCNDIGAIDSRYLDSGRGPLYFCVFNPQ